MSKVKFWHPSEVWEWFKENNRHENGGNAFVSFPDYKKLLSCLELIATHDPEAIGNKPDYLVAQECLEQIK